MPSSRNHCEFWNEWSFCLFVFQWIRLLLDTMNSGSFSGWRIWVQAISDFFESMEIRIKHDPSQPQWFKLNWKRWLFKAQNRLAVSSDILTSLSLFISFLLFFPLHSGQTLGKKRHAKTKNLDYIHSYPKQSKGARNSVRKCVFRGQVNLIVNKASELPSDWCLLSLLVLFVCLKVKCLGQPGLDLLLLLKSVSTERHTEKIHCCGAALSISNGCSLQIWIHH